MTDKRFPRSTPRDHARQGARAEGSTCWCCNLSLMSVAGATGLVHFHLVLEKPSSAMRRVHPGCVPAAVADRTCVYLPPSKDTK